MYELFQTILLNYLKNKILYKNHGEFQTKYY